MKKANERFRSRMDPLAPLPAAPDDHSLSKEEVDHQPNTNQVRRRRRFLPTVLGIYHKKPEKQSVTAAPALSLAQGLASASRAAVTSGGFQSPEPGFGEKWVSNLPATPSNSAASAGGSLRSVMFGHFSA